ncbi:MAG: hypothetical protein FJ405_04805 [Verrucomicrobia bacterium]|nr:hypothetical protein [Verrucomicrobiota bacterium]
MLRTSHAPGSVHSSNLPLAFTLRHGSSPIRADLLQVDVNGTPYAGDIQIRSNSFSISVVLPWSLPRESDHRYLIKAWSVGESTPWTREIQFRTDVRGPGGLSVEIEDYDHQGGKHAEKASQPGYSGGGYSGKTGRAG